MSTEETKAPDCIGCRLKGETVEGCRGCGEKQKPQEESADD